MKPCVVQPAAHRTGLVPRVPCLPPGKAGKPQRISYGRLMSDRTCRAGGQNGGSDSDQEPKSVPGPPSTPKAGPAKGLWEQLARTSDEVANLLTPKQAVRVVLQTGPGPGSAFMADKYDGADILLMVLSTLLLIWASASFYMVYAHIYYSMGWKTIGEMMS